MSETKGPSDVVPESPIRDHNYDGIQEYDNPLPNWWVWGFVFTVIFGAIYIMHYESGSGPTLQQELATQMAEIEKMGGGQVRASESEDDLAAVFLRQEIISNGKAVFAVRCLVCHGDAGQGLIGPNLTDNFWISGSGTRTEIISVIRKGVIEKGMPAWDAMLSGDEVKAVAAHVYSLKGTKPANPKAPQGVEVK